MKKIGLLFGGSCAVLLIGTMLWDFVIALVGAVVLGGLGVFVTGLRVIPENHVRAVIRAGSVTRLVRGVAWILWPIEKLGPTIYTGTRFRDMVFEGVLTSDQISLELRLTVLYGVDPDQAENDMLSQVVFYSEAMWEQTIRFLTEGVVQSAFISRPSSAVRDDGGWGAIQREIRDRLQNEAHRFGIVIENHGVILRGVKPPQGLESAIIAAEEVRIDNLARAEALENMLRVASAHPGEQFDIPLALQLVQALSRNGGPQLFLSSPDLRNLFGFLNMQQRQGGDGQEPEGPGNVAVRGTRRE